MERTKRPALLALARIFAGKLAVVDVVTQPR
jgi:hypothetical protein